MTKQTNTLDATILDIGHRLDTLINRGDAENIWPEKILDEDFILRSMFPDGKSQALKTLTMTYIRLERVVRFLEENLVPELDDRASQKDKPEKDMASDASRANH
jgi:hypothetical protein